MLVLYTRLLCFFFFQAEDGIRDLIVTGVQTCALPIWVLVTQPGGRACGTEVEIGHGVGAERAQLGDTLPRLERPAGRPRAAVLREDLDHTRRRFGAVQRARRRTLDDLDVIHVGGIDIVERARLVIRAPERVRVRVVERRAGGPGGPPPPPATVATPIGK